MTSPLRAEVLFPRSGLLYALFIYIGYIGVLAIPWGMGRTRTSRDTPNTH